MFQVKPMRAGDFAFATKLANTMDWNMAIEDFEFTSSLEPEGCFVVFQGSERLGIATSISFGDVGWFGNLIVKEKYRKKGVGSLLVEHAMKYLQGKGAKAIGLYAYPHLVNFYSNLGFKLDEDFLVLSTEALKPSIAQTQPKSGVQKIKEILEFDRCCFGGDRKRLLESIIFEKGNLCNFESNGQEIVGYVAATVYEKMAWVGPLMCKAHHIDEASSLLNGVLAKLRGLSIYTALPKKETALTHMLFNAGFREDFCVSRMFLGHSVSKNCIYIAESLERG